MSGDVLEMQSTIPVLEGREGGVRPWRPSRDVGSSCRVIITAPGIDVRLDYVSAETVWRVSI